MLDLLFRCRIMCKSYTKLWGFKGFHKTVLQLLLGSQFWDHMFAIKVKYLPSNNITLDYFSWLFRSCPNAEIFIKGTFFKVFSLFVTHLNHYDSSCWTNASCALLWFLSNTVPRELKLVKSSLITLLSECLFLLLSGVTRWELLNVFVCERNG